MAQRPSLVRAAGVVSIATAISRLTGLLREMSIAATFPRQATDAFWAAFRVPNLLRDLLAEGSLSAAFVPVYADVQHNRGRAAAFALASSVMNGLLIVTGLFSLSIMVLAKWYALSIVSGFSPDKLALTAFLARLMAPFLIFLALAAVMMGMSNVEGKFFVPALAPALFNLGWIAGSWLLAPVCRAHGWPESAALSLGAVLGGACQFAMQIPGVVHTGYRHQLLLVYRDPAFRTIMLRMAPALIGVGATYINTVFDNQIASRFGDGPVSYFTYAFRFWLLPVGVFGVAISTANLAGVARESAQGNRERFNSVLATSIRLTLLLAIPSAVALAVLGRSIVRVVYQHGHFTADGTAPTALLLALYAIGLPGYSLVKLFVPTLYALGRPWVAVGISMTVIALKVASNLVLFHAGFGYPFLALTTGLAALGNAGATGWAVFARTGWLTGYAIGRSLATAFVGSSAMVAAVLAVGWGVNAVLPGDDWWPCTIRLALQIGVGLSAVAFVVARSGLPEAERLSALLARLVGRRGDA